MPYVNEEKADALNEWHPGPANDLDLDSNPIDKVVIHSAGELGYVVGEAIRSFLAHRTEEMGELRFQIVGEIMGTLDSIARDFWDKVGRPYEAKVEKENDVFHWDNKN